MKFLRRGDASTTDNLADQTSAADSGSGGGSANTSDRPAATGKGRPTPKRRDAQGRRRGPVAPAPLTAKEARARRKAARGTREERKAASAQRRADAAERRQRMLAGEDKFLPARDRGPVRAYVRDLVDARRNLVGLFMPLALVLIFTMFLTPAVQAYVTLAMLVMMAFMAAEGFLLGRIVNRRVRERFPDSTDSSLSLGWYAFVRASQVRRMRAPKPRVNPGDAV
ncbi:DUF3043 domain-containing protein [Nocardia transvalensis]|uniref:DUF3043 domain-containing protein n=1 Tax=Nocardia transvalensis TaxID=37333 RepID=UPI001895AB95|nr:DUF3043 domain-containing protein [Nocardia transvalensis]MBF6330232.1 DUF3043 domain-containing protein [Nocardia transvalensis]